MRRIVLLLVTLAASYLAVYGNVTEAVTSDSLDVRVYFRQGASDIDLDFNDNGARIDSLVQRLKAMIDDSAARRIERIRLFAGAVAGRLLYPKQRAFRTPCPRYSGLSA